MRWLLPLLLVLALVILPVGLATWRQGTVVHWSGARWDSTGMAPDPATTRDAVVQVYCAASWGLKGAVADHCWIAVKPENATGYIIVPEDRLGQEYPSGIDSVMSELQRVAAKASNAIVSRTHG